MKPLEPGCLAIVISDNENPENVGKEVVLQFKLNAGDKVKIGLILDGRSVLCSGDTQTASWVVNGNVKSFITAEGERLENGEGITFKGLAECFIGANGNKNNAAFEPHQLMRIDDFSDEDKQKDREQEIGRGLLTPVGLVEWESYGIYP